MQGQSELETLELEQLEQLEPELELMEAQVAVAHVLLVLDTKELV